MIVQVQVLVLDLSDPVSVWSRNIFYTGLGWVTDWPCPYSVSGAGQQGNLSRYVTSHPGQLSLAIPSLVGAMSTSQRVVTPCGWGVKAGMVCVWVAGKTVWSLVKHKSYMSILRWCIKIKCYIKSCYFTLPHCVGKAPSMQICKIWAFTCLEAV